MLPDAVRLRIDRAARVLIAHCRNHMVDQEHLLLDVWAGGMTSHLAPNASATAECDEAKSPQAK